MFRKFSSFLKKLSHELVDFFWSILLHPVTAVRNVSEREEREGRERERESVCVCVCVRERERERGEERCITKHIVLNQM